MANEYIYLKGKVKWCRPSAPDPWGNWKTEQYLEGDDLERVRELQARGLKNVIKKDEDGYFTTWRRPVQKVYNGKVTGFAPPEVLDGSRKLDDGSYAPLRDVNIGNGSDCIIKLQIYSHKVPGGGDKKGIAARWESIRVDNLVPFEGKKDFTDIEEKQVRGLENVPPQALF